MCSRAEAMPLTKRVVCFCFLSRKETCMNTALAESRTELTLSGLFGRGSRSPRSPEPQRAGRAFKDALFATVEKRLCEIWAKPLVDPGVDME